MERLSSQSTRLRAELKKAESDVSDLRHELVDTQRQLAAAQQRAANWEVSGSENRLSAIVFVCVYVCV